MANHKIYSSAKFFALCILFTILGTTFAVSITTFIPQPAQPPSNFVLLTDKDTYYINETMIIYIMNTLQETIEFRDDAYGLLFERWINGKWEFILSIGNSSRTTMLQPVGAGTYKAAVTYKLGENFMEGKYRVISVGEVTKNGEIASVESYREFNVVVRPPPQSVLLLLTVKTDKAAYNQGDNITVTLENESNETLTFGDSAYGLFFEKWNGASWEFYTWVSALEIITTLNAGEKAEFIYRLGQNPDKPFPQGKYRVVSVGWIYRDEKFIQVGGFAEFMVE